MCLWGDDAHGQPWWNRRPLLRALGLTHPLHCLEVVGFVSEFEFSAAS